MLNCLYYTLLLDKSQVIFLLLRLNICVDSAEDPGGVFVVRETALAFYNFHHLGRQGTYICVSVDHGTTSVGRFVGAGAVGKQEVEDDGISGF